ncbi:MAG: glutaminyl-peptide cyclotransferase [Candidatus Cryptobacteroides sp.]
MSIILAAAMLAGCSSKPEVKEYGVKVVSKTPHDVHSYTQGLFFYNGRMYESTGQYGESTFRQVDIESGKAEKRLDFDAKYFVEGSVELNGRIYILTWMEKTAFVYNAETLEFEQAWSYPREGWGLTTDGRQLIASDGSNVLYFMDENFSVNRKIYVTLHDRPVRWLNELEWIDGRIWANVYTTDSIVIINPKDGKVEATVDCKGLLERKYRTRDTDVLNGIAHDKKSGRTYLTGKNWPFLFEIELFEKK